MKKINLRTVLFIFFACCFFLLGIAFLSQSRPRLMPPPTVTTTTTTRKYVPTTKPKGVDSQFFMNTKYRGDCKALTGKVLLNFYMVSDGDCIWTDQAIDEFKQATNDALHLMNLDAQRFGIDLEVTCDYVPISMPEQMIRNEYLKFIPKILQSLGYEDKNTVSPTLAAKHGPDSAAVIFCFNRDERSFALPTSNEHGFEYCVLYGAKEDFRHEVYHLYGARDLYTPDHIDTISARFFPDSVMRVSGGMVVDPLTAFLLGWSNRMDDRVKDFLEAVDR